MGLFDWLGKVGHKDAEHNTQVWIASDQVLTGVKGGVSPAAERHYVRIWLAEMFLRDNEKWFTSRYPLAYSLASLDFGDHKALEFANVSGKNKLDIKQTDVGRLLLYNYPLTPLLPFRGGTIALDCGLVSMQADNIVKSFASVVSDFAGKLGGAQVSATADLASSIAGSVQELLGAGDAKTKLYYHNVFAATGGAAPLVSGFLFLSEAQEGKIEPGSLWVTRDGVRQGREANSLKALAPQDYMLIQIEVTAERDDYRAFSYIADPFNDALAAKADGDDARARLLTGQAKKAVQRSPDFTAADGKRIRLAIDAALENHGWETLTEGTVDRPPEEPGSQLEAAILRLPLAQADVLDEPDAA